MLLAKITAIPWPAVVTATFCADVRPANDKISSSLYSQIIIEISDGKLGGGSEQLYHNTSAQAELLACRAKAWTTSLEAGGWPGEVGKQQETVSPRISVTPFSVHHRSSRKGTVDARPASVGRLVTAEVAASTQTPCQK